MIMGRRLVSRCAGTGRREKSFGAVEKRFQRSQGELNMQGQNNRAKVFLPCGNHAFCYAVSSAEAADTGKRCWTAASKQHWEVACV